MFSTSSMAALCIALAQAAPTATPDAPPPPDAPAPASSVLVEVPPDLVVFKAGGMARGVILEAFPDGPVKFRSADGETRVLDRATLAYFGPASGFTPPSPASPPSTAPPVVEAAGAPNTGSVRFESTPPGLTMFTSVGRTVAHTTAYMGRAGWGSAATRAEAWERVCMSPCTATLEGTQHRFGLALGDGDPIEVGEYDVAPGARLVGTYTTNRATRVGLIAAGAGAFIAAIVSWPESNCSAGGRCEQGSVVLPTVLLVLGTALMGGAALVPDDATLEVAPSRP
jgi:hypothetical protein